MVRPVTSLVAKLESDGLVSRRPDPSDGRAVLLFLTADGREVLRSRHADRVTNLSRLVKQLTDEEREVLADSARVLKRLGEIDKAEETD
jgi:DNA-binding MarR family transcriptional regulator